MLAELLKKKCFDNKNNSPQKHLKPKGDPLDVYGELNLRNIQKVDDANMEISLEITFR